MLLPVLVGKDKVTPVDQVVVLFTPVNATVLTVAAVFDAV